MKLRTIVFTVLSLLVANLSFADKLRGYVWEASVSVIVVDGQAIRLVPETTIQRPNQDGIAAKDLRVGWEVEVDARGDATSGFVARSVKVKTPRNAQEQFEGVVDRVNGTRFWVDGDEVRLARGSVPAGLRPGMRFKGNGIRMDDRTIELREGELMPAEFVGEEAQFMSLASKEIAQMKAQIKPINDPALQTYVERVGRSLVPKWVDPQQFQFTFSVIEDPTLNAFALPDGTVVIHTGLLAVLENEAQLATVLGHEIAHTTHRHGYRGFKDQQTKQMWFGLGSMAAGIALGERMNSPLVGLAAGLGSNLMMQAAVNGHGRKLEDEADEIGLYYMTEAGYDYMEAPEVWRVFGKYTQDQSKVSNFFFSNHSTHEARIRNLTKAINVDYRAQLPRTGLRTGEADFEKATEKLAQQNALANLQSQEYAQAGRALAEQIARNPNDATAYYNHARVLWAQGGAKNAQQVLDELGTAIQLDPTMAGPWRDAGVVFYELRDTNRAAAAFERYLQLNPNDPEAAKLRAFISAARTQ